MSIDVWALLTVECLHVEMVVVAPNPHLCRDRPARLTSNHRK